MHVFVVLNQSNLFTTHKSYVGLILIIKFITLICFWVNHNNSLLYKNFLYRKNWSQRLKNIQEGSWMGVQFLSKINKLKAMNKGQVSKEIVVLLWRGGELYQLKCIIYIVSYFYLVQCRYVKEERDISGPLKNITLSNLFHGASFLQHHPTMVLAEDATSASKKNYLSFANMNYHHSIKIMNSCPHTATKQSITAKQLMNKAFTFTATPIMQISKVYKWWLWIFLTIESPDEWVIMK